MHPSAPAVVAALALVVPQAMTAPIAATMTRIPSARTPSATDVPTVGREWAGGSDGTGIFSVGSQAGDGISAVIPPGRYAVKLSPGAQEGSWMLCDTALCGPAFRGNATVIGRPIGPSASAMYIGARSRTLWLDNVTLSQSRDVSREAS